MKHCATSTFWNCYRRLRATNQQLADKNYKLLKNAPEHPSLRFKKVGAYSPVRSGIAYRALWEFRRCLVWGGGGLCGVGT